MPTRPPTPREGLYRRVSPKQWNKQEGRPHDAAFLLRPADAGGLSVYAAELTTPRQVLKDLLDDYGIRRLSPDLSERERAERWFAQNGETPEDLVRSGWRVVGLGRKDFTQRGFALTPADERGHLTVVGPLEEFQRLACELAAASNDATADVVSSIP